VSDPLEPFRAHDAQAPDRVGAGHERTLLVFEHGGALYGVPAQSVDALIAWRKPARLPASVPGLAGVVQDRGRIISVLTSPLCQPSEAEPRRIVICVTAYGFIGLPCGETRRVGPVVLAQEPQSGEVTDSSEGPLVFVDPERVVEELRRT
jgi:chemotaxis signal transduction protein